MDRLSPDGMQATLSGRPGAAYVDIPSDILFAQLPRGSAPPLPQAPPPRQRARAGVDAIERAAQLLMSAQRCALACCCLCGKKSRRYISETHAKLLRRALHRRRVSSPFHVLPQHEYRLKPPMTQDVSARGPPVATGLAAVHSIPAALAAHRMTTGN